VRVAVRLNAALKESQVDVPVRRQLVGEPRRVVQNLVLARAEEKERIAGDVGGVIARVLVSDAGVEGLWRRRRVVNLKNGQTLIS
jgi:hypothetical protein